MLPGKNQQDEQSQVYYNFGDAWLAFSTNRSVFDSLCLIILLFIDVLFMGAILPTASRIVDLVSSIVSRTRLSVIFISVILAPVVFEVAIYGK